MIAMLLDRRIKNDHRVIKMIETISRKQEVHLYYLDGNEEEDLHNFTSNVRLFCLQANRNLFNKILQHSFFCHENDFFIAEVLKRGVKYEYIWANDLPTLYPAYRIAQKLNAKLVYDSHEIYTETINQFFPVSATGIKKLIFNSMIGLMRRHGAHMERKILPKLDTFITVNQSLMDYFKARAEIRNGIVVMNFPRTSHEASSDARIDFRAQFNWKSSDTILIYQGNLNGGRGLHLLLEVMKKLEDNIKLIILGDGTLKESLKDFATANGLNEKVKFIDFVPIADLLQYTRGADIGINLLEDLNLSKKFASPNKLFEYIHAGIPVLCSNTIENKRIIDRFPIGLLVENNTEDLVHGVHEIITFKNEGLQPGLFEEAAKVYSWEHQCATIDHNLFKN